MDASQGPAPADPGRPVRVGGLAAMRALAHPVRVRMLQLLRAEPMSASALARRLDIRVGSAQYHLRTLERAGIARRAGERRKRGGTEILFAVPRPLRVDLDAGSPASLRAVHHAFVGELGRRMDAAAAEPGLLDTDRDAFAIRELELRPEAVPAAVEALRAFLDRLDALALDRPAAGSVPFTASAVLFRIPRSASGFPDGPA
jgi:DNA-binding transcriptional ArsR family regulator